MKTTAPFFKRWTGHRNSALWRSRDGQYYSGHPCTDAVQAVDIDALAAAIRPGAVFYLDTLGLPYHGMKLTIPPNAPIIPYPNRIDIEVLTPAGHAVKVDIFNITPYKPR